MSLFFTVCAIACLLLALGAVVVFPLFLATFGLTSMDEPLIGLLRWPAMFLLVVFGLSVLYRYGPSRRRAEMALDFHRQRVRRIGVARRAPRCFRFIWQTSPTTTRPMVRSAP